MVVQQSPLSSWDAVTWWRNAYQRDREAFVVSNGREPESVAELSRWLKPIPNRQAELLARNEEE